MERSIFEQCPTIWRPSSYTTVNNLNDETIQKKAVKQIRQDFSVSYTFNEFLYHIDCKQLNMLPLKFRFDFHDLTFFNNVFYNFSCLNMPLQVNLYSSKYKTKIHSMNFVSNVNLSGHTAALNIGGFSHSYFYRTHFMWNLLPLFLCKILPPSDFKTKLSHFIWSEIVINNITRTVNSLKMKYRIMKTNFPFFFLFCCCQYAHYSYTFQSYLLVSLQV